MVTKIKSLIILLLASMLLISCATTKDISAENNTKSSDLALIMQWWSGDYNNNKQLASLMKEGRPVWKKDGSGKGGHIEVTSHYRPVELPAFGEHVIYVEETKHGESDNIFRQRIYTLTVDEEIDAVRVKLWYFNDKEKYVGAWQDLAKLNDLTPADMFPLQDGCDLIAQRKKNKIHMPMPDKDCVFGEKYFNYQVLLGPDSFWFRDRIMNVADDSVAESAGDFTYHELDRIVD